MPYGCYNADRSHKPIMLRAPRSEADDPCGVEVAYRFTHDCQYSLTELGQKDKGCEGCEHKQPLPK